MNYHVHRESSFSPLAAATPYQHAVYERLQRVLGWHGLDAGRSAQLLAPHGFTFADVTDPVRTVGLYNEDLLLFLTDFFQVSRTYLLAQSDQPQMPDHAYYKHVQTLCAATVEGHNEGRLSHVFVLKKEASARSKIAARISQDFENDVVILTVFRDMLAGQELYTFRLWEALPWSYPNSRLDIKCFLLFLENAAERGRCIQVIGGTLDAKVADDLMDGQIHAAQIIRGGYWGRGERWYPTDFVSSYAHLARETHEQSLVAEWYARQNLERFVDALTLPADQSTL